MDKYWYYVHILGKTTSNIVRIPFDGYSYSDKLNLSRFFKDDSNGDKEMTREVYRKGGRLDDFNTDTELELKEHRVTIFRTAAREWRCENGDVVVRNEGMREWRYCC